MVDRQDIVSETDSLAAFAEKQSRRRRSQLRSVRVGGDVSLRQIVAVAVSYKTGQTIDRDVNARYAIDRSRLRACCAYRPHDNKMAWH